MRDIELYAKKCLEAAVEIGIPKGLDGVAESIAKPEYATAIGLAMYAAESGDLVPSPSKKAKKSGKKSSDSGPFGFVKKIFSKF